jgi:hypothetical protein
VRKSLTSKVKRCILEGRVVCKKAENSDRNKLRNYLQNESFIKISQTVLLL